MSDALNHFSADVCGPQPKPVHWPAMYGGGAEEVRLEPEKPTIEAIRAGTDRALTRLYPHQTLTLIKAEAESLVHRIMDHERGADLTPLFGSEVKQRLDIIRRFAAMLDDGTIQRR